MQINTRTPMKRLLIWAAWLALTACSSVPESPVKEQRAALDARTPCCADLKTVTYAPLPLKVVTKTVLDEKAPVREFQTGRSYFQAFALPEAQERGVWIKSYFNGILIKQYLQPVVMLLDANHQELGTMAPRTRFSEGNMFSSDQNARIEGGLRLPPEARYMVLFTMPFNAPPSAAQMRPSGSAFMMGSTPVIMTSPGKRIELERAWTGELSLEVEPLPPPQ